MHVRAVPSSQLVLLFDLCASEVGELEILHLQSLGILRVTVHSRISVESTGKYQT